MLLEHDPTAQDGRGLWVKLWRDMMWGTLRSASTTRAPFEARANGQEASDVEDTWSDLLRPREYGVELPSTYYLGAQASTAENVPFRDRARFRFLLHFWPYASQVYVPAVIDTRENKREFVGYAIAIPDVSELESFCDALWSWLLTRGTAPAGYRPREAVVDLAVEGALDMMQRLRERLVVYEGKRSSGDLVLGVEVFHLAKEGNNIRMLSTSRLEPDAMMGGEYRRLRERLWDPLFRRTRLLNLVSRRPWYAGFDRLFATLPYKEQGIGSESFGHDARVSFEDSRKGSEPVTTETGKTESEDIEQLVYQLVGRYVSRKVEAKTGKRWEQVKELPESMRGDYNTAREKVAKDAFLQVRSRTGSDFVAYFVGTLCSVPHHLGGARFGVLSKALQRETEKVRTLTLLALSAHG
jgi:CRISPR-associated protein Cmx8